MRHRLFRPLPSTSAALVALLGVVAVAHAAPGFNVTTPASGDGRVNARGTVDYDGRIVHVSGSTDDICPSDDYGVQLTLWPYNGTATAGDPIIIHNGSGCGAAPRDFNRTLRPYSGQTIQRVRIGLCEYKAGSGGGIRDCVSAGDFRR